MNISLRKAAILLSSIPEADSAELLSQLSAPEIEQIAAATRELKSIDEGERQQIAADLVDQSYHRRTSAPGAASTSGESRDWNSVTQGSISDLQICSAAWIATQLSRELPQTVAVVLAHLNADLAADVFGRLSTELQIQVAERAARTESIPSTAIECVLERLSAKSQADKLAGIGGRCGIAFVAQIVKRLDGATERALLENLAQQDRELVDELLRVMFVLRDQDRISHAA